MDYPKQNKSEEQRKNSQKTRGCDKRNIIWLAYHRGKIFIKLKQRKEKYTNIISRFGVSRSATSFKILITRLIKEFLKKSKTLLPLYFLKKTYQNHLKNLQRQYYKPIIRNTYLKYFNP